MHKLNSHICLFTLFCVTLLTSRLAAQDRYIIFEKKPGAFPLSVSGKPAPIYVSDVDHTGVIRAAKDLQTDIGRVTGTTPALLMSAPSGKDIVIVGTLGKSPLIDQLVRDKKLDVDNVTGKWETFVLQVIEKPMPGVDRAFVIAGSDKRGTIFGIYDVSKQIGVSAWHWWADVPPQKNSSLYVLPTRIVQGEPPVKYRGLFINDEEPALGRWAVDTYGGFNHPFYEKVFELILRMKGNYLWPAMWWASFNSDDTLNPALADEYGIVVGTTHHEPMMRAHAEWRKNGKGGWNYETNRETLRQFWTEGIRRMDSHESIVSLGMRGDGDMAMSEGTNIALLETIVKDQRDIIQSVTGKEASATPQLWALYKEVQDYYDKGMRVPDDVTLLLCDDNWGNIRKLPKIDDAPRSGGYGIYYHFDYVGGPRNYKWLNTNQVERTWEQMNLAYRYGATRIWIVNVGDIKPLEFPTEFFLDYAWDPQQWNPDNLKNYTRQWAERQFGKVYADDIASILTLYTRYNARIKPELLSPETYSLLHYREAETIVADYNKLATLAQEIYNKLPAAYQDAYYQLVLHPVRASANLNELYVTTARNRLYAEQGRAATNDLADRVKALFDNDTTLAHYYNKVMSKGKWNHMMDQTHISYTNWQQPEKDVMPEVKRIVVPNAAAMGVSIEGSGHWWPQEKQEAALPVFDVYNQPSYFIDVFNRGKTPFPYAITTAAPYVLISAAKGTVEKEQRVSISIDWTKAPAGTQRVPVTITGPGGKKVIVQVVISNPTSPARDRLKGFVESNGYVSMEAEHYSKTVNTSSIQWKVIPGLGRTLSGITSFPVTEKSTTPGSNCPHLQYIVHLADTGKVSVKAYLSPTLNFHNTQGLRFAISFDDEAPQVINLHEDGSVKTWNQWVSNNIAVKTSRHSIKQKGEHILKFWRIDPDVVLQKLVVETTGSLPCYLGPPESFRK